MSRMRKIGLWVIGGIASIAFVCRQRISFGLKDVYLAGYITNQLIPIRATLWIKNDTIGGVLVRNLTGNLLCNGEVVATINQPINKRLYSGYYVEQTVVINIQSDAALSSLLKNINSGDISNLAFEFVGQVIVGEQFPFAYKFNRVFTWSEIQGAL